MNKLIVNCPQCDHPVIWISTSKFRPFCSERCKLNDLGQWAAESYRIPEPTKELKDQEESIG